MTDKKWDAMQAYAVVSDIIASDPKLVHAVIGGITAGFEAKIEKFRDEANLTNMALDMALTLGDKRVSATTRRMADMIIAKRLLAFGEWTNKTERDFLESIASRSPAPTSESP